LPVSVLGIDLASKSWRDNGSALLTFERERFVGARVPAISWPLERALTPAELAEVVDGFARAEGVAAVSIDGPQAWRDPDAPAEQGAGRACERAARTAGKTGVVGTCYPSTYLGWISFSVAVFGELAARAHVTLVEDTTAPVLSPPRGSYHLLECFPTSTWRASGLARFRPRGGACRSRLTPLGCARRTAFPRARSRRATTTCRRSSRRCRRSDCSAGQRRRCRMGVRRGSSAASASRG